LIQLLAFLVAGKSGGRDSNHGEVSDGDLDRRQNRRAVRFGAIAANADLTKPLRADLDGELGCGRRELRVERSNLAVEGVKFLNGLRLDANLRKLRIDLAQVLGDMLDRLELAGELVLALCTDGCRDKLLKLLLAAGQSME
jgi:hypothetical protein